MSALRQWGYKLTLKKIEKLREGEYAPYAIMYIGLVPDDGLVLKHLKDDLKATFMTRLETELR